MSNDWAFKTDIVLEATQLAAIAALLGGLKLEDRSKPLGVMLPFKAQMPLLESMIPLSDT